MLRNEVVIETFIREINTSTNRMENIRSKICTDEWNVLCISSCHEESGKLHSISYALILRLYIHTRVHP